MAESEDEHIIDRNIRAAIFWITPLILISVLIPLLALFLGVMPETETLATWFQRSGSLMVLFSLGAEYLLFSISTHVNPSGMRDIFDGTMMHKYGRLYKVLTAFALMSIITGTMIWGYGDLILLYFLDSHL